MAAALALLAALVVPFAFWGEDIEKLAPEIAMSQEASAAVFLSVVALLASDIALPIPTSIVAYFSGQLLGFLIGATANLAGLTLGCIIGYVLGRSFGRPISERLIGKEDQEKLDMHFAKWGRYSVAVLRGMPVLAEASILLAGVSRVGFAKSMLLAAPANVCLSVLFALAGSEGVGTLSGITIFLAAIIFPGILVGLIGWHKPRK